MKRIEGLSPWQKLYEAQIALQKNRVIRCPHPVTKRTHYVVYGGINALICKSCGFWVSSPNSFRKRDYLINKRGRTE